MASFRFLWLALAWLMLVPRMGGVEPQRNSPAWGDREPELAAAPARAGARLNRLASASKGDRRVTRDNCRQCRVEPQLTSGGHSKAEMGGHPLFTLVAEFSHLGRAPSALLLVSTGRRFFLAPTRCDAALARAPPV